MKKSAYILIFLIVAMMLSVFSSSPKMVTDHLNGVQQVQHNPPKLIAVPLKTNESPQYVVVIDPGHGGSDQGAEGVSGRNESDFTLSVALKVRDLIAADHEIKLYLTRSDDTFISLNDRINMANQLQADVFLSIHANEDKDASIGGTETFINRTGSEIFGNIVQKYVQQATGFPDRKVAYDIFRVIKNTNMPAALVEVGFVSNKAEDKALFDDTMQNKIAAAIATAIKTYLVTFS